MSSSNIPSLADLVGSDIEDDDETPVPRPPPQIPQPPMPPKKPKKPRPPIAPLPVPARALPPDPDLYAPLNLPPDQLTLLDPFAPRITVTPAFAERLAINMYNILFREYRNVPDKGYHDAPWIRKNSIATPGQIPVGTNVAWRLRVHEFLDTNLGSPPGLAACYAYLLTQWYNSYSRARDIRKKPNIVFSTFCGPGFKHVMDAYEEHQPGLPDLLVFFTQRNIFFEKPRARDGAIRSGHAVLTVINFKLRTLTIINSWDSDWYVEPGIDEEAAWRKAYRGDLDDFENAKVFFEPEEREQQLPNVTLFSCIPLEFRAYDDQKYLISYKVWQDNIDDRYDEIEKYRDMIHHMVEAEGFSYQYFGTGYQGYYVGRRGEQYRYDCGYLTLWNMAVIALTPEAAVLGFQPGYTFPPLPDDDTSSWRRLIVHAVYNNEMRPDLIPVDAREFVMRYIKRFDGSTGRKYPFYIPAKSNDEREPWLVAKIRRNPEMLERPVKDSVEWEEEIAAELSKWVIEAVEVARKAGMSLKATQKNIIAQIKPGDRIPLSFHELNADATRAWKEFIKKVWERTPLPVYHVIDDDDDYGASVPEPVRRIHPPTPPPSDLGDDDDDDDDDDEDDGLSKRQRKRARRGGGRIFRRFYLE